MRGKVHILVNCPIDTFLKEKQHSALFVIILFDKCCQRAVTDGQGKTMMVIMVMMIF